MLFDRLRALRRGMTPAAAAAVALVLGGSGAARGVIYTYENSTSGAIPTIASGGTVFNSTSTPQAITNNAYNGTQGSMACRPITIASDGADTIVGPVTVTVAISHQWVGDLVIKVYPPPGSTAFRTLAFRPGFAESGDNGAGGDPGGGSTSNLSTAVPVTFAMAAATDAELMGTGSPTNVCGALPCNFNPGAGTSGTDDNLATLNGQSKVGTWNLCVGDAAAGTGTSGQTQTGSLQSWTLDLGAVSGGGGTCAANGLPRTFVVNDSFTVSTIALGFNATHASRGQIRAELFAPNGSSAVFVNQGADTLDNYDIQLSTFSDGVGSLPLNDASDDPVGEPYYARLVTFAGANFYNGNANGTWTLRVCDMVSGTDGSFARAKLILNDGQEAPEVCAVPIEYEWGDNGNNAVFNSAQVAGVTITRVNPNRDLTADGADTAGRVNFTTQDATSGLFGNESGYFIMQFDAEDDADPPSDFERVLLETKWNFDPPVRHTNWTHLDVDNGSWEDYIRIIGTDLGDANVPYSVTINPAIHGLVGDIIETSGPNVEGNDASGNVSYNFSGAVSQITVQYMVGDDPGPNSQRIGIGNPNFCAFDYGDAPDTGGALANYGTTLANNGARHVLGLRRVYLGGIPPDGEANGVSSPALSDDQNGTLADPDLPDDEDATQPGIFPLCPNNGTYTISIPASNTTNPAVDAYLVGYFDWNRDGDFNDAGEESATVTVPQGNVDPFGYNVVWSAVPANCGGTTTTYARFRISTAQAQVESPIGLATDGEVEDYQIAAGTLPVTIAWVASERAGGRLAVEWATATESFNAGFRIWGVDAEGRRQLLGKVESETPDSFAPRYYEARFPAAKVAAIEIEDVALVGNNRLHGPFAVGSEVGERPTGPAIDWAAIRAEARTDGPLGRSSAVADRPWLEEQRIGRRATGSGERGLLLVRETGIQRVSYEELLSAGIDLGGTLIDQIAVLNNGVGVARHVESESDTFGSSSYIEFVGRPQLTLASPVDVYVLAVNAAKVVAAGSMASRPGPLGVTVAEDRYHPDRAYSYSSPNGDPWFDQGLLAWGGAASLTRSFDLPNLVPGSVTIDFSAWGYIDWPGVNPPDHHFLVRVNGTQVADERFDGITSRQLTLDVSDLVSESGNVIELALPGDTGYSFDYAALEGFTVRYSRETVALGGRFEGAYAQPYSIGGLPDEAPVSIWRSVGSQAQRSRPYPVGGKVPVPGGGTVFAATESALYHPQVIAGAPAAQTASAANYLIVIHPAFAAAVGDLAALEQSRGLTTEVVTVDKIFAAYSDHAASPDALKDFLRASFASGNLRYVLLVGSDTTDPYDHLGVGSISYVPTAYVPYAYPITFSPTDEHLVDFDGDAVGEVPIGRLPVRTPAELQEVVSKLYAWEQSIAARGRSALLAAGASDSEALAISLVNQSYGASLTGWSTAVAQVDDLGTSEARADILAALNAGTPLVSYVGHSSSRQWDFTPLLRWQDAATLTNIGAPTLLAQWGCWNSYYMNPEYESLSAHFLRQPDVGAAGAIGALTLTTDAAHQALGNLFYARVGAGATRVGDAFRGAKLDLAAQRWGRDALLGMALLGDPAMSLPAVGK